MSQINIEGGHIAQDPKDPARMVTVCDRCGNQAPIGKSVTLIPGEPYFIECQRRTKCAIPFPSLPADWTWQRIGSRIYVGLSPEALACQQAAKAEAEAEAAARQHADQQALLAQRNAAQAQKDFFTRGKGARQRNRHAKALVALFQNFRDMCIALERRKMITRQELLAKGWTAREIDKLLGRPDDIETWRHRGTSGSRHLYRRDRVEAAPRAGIRRFSICSSQGACTLVVSSDQRVWLEPHPAGPPISLAGEVEQALEAVAMTLPSTATELALWKQLVQGLIENDQVALSRLCAPVPTQDTGTGET